MTTPHRCSYTLVVSGRVISVSQCHYGQTLNQPAPACKPRPGTA